MASIIEHSFRIGGSEARATAAAGCAGTSCAFGARTRGPHARRRRTSGYDGAGCSAWTQAACANSSTDAVL